MQPRQAAGEGGAGVLVRVAEGDIYSCSLINKITLGTEWLSEIASIVISAL